MVTKKEKEYKSDGWLTFLQAREKGLKIKKGSKAVSIFRGFGKVIKQKDNGKAKDVSVPMGWAYVFNMDQTEKFK